MRCAAADTAGASLRGATLALVRSDAAERARGDRPRNERTHELGRGDPQARRQRVIERPPVRVSQVYFVFVFVFICALPPVSKIFVDRRCTCT